MSRAFTEELAPLKDGAGYPYPVEDMQLRLSETYSNNPMVRKAFVKRDLTPEQTMEIIKCRRDPIYFMEKYLRIITLDYGIQPFKLFEFQRRMVKQYVDNRFSLTLTSRQMGKCCFGSTALSIRSNKTGARYDIPIEVFYEWQRFRQYQPEHAAEYLDLCTGEQGDVSEVRSAVGSVELHSLEDARDDGR